jgi:hypothetical protein
MCSEYDLWALHFTHNNLIWGEQPDVPGSQRRACMRACMDPKDVML